MEPSDGYISYIVNPKSGSGNQRLVSRQFKKHLLHKGFEVRVAMTSSLENACELATDAAVDFNCAVVVVAGGDGTVREVAHGLEGSDKPMLIVPCGTENLLANELGFDEKIQTVINAFNDGQTKTMDLGSANGKCFTSIAGFGFDGEVVRRVSERRVGHIDYFDYFWPIWRTFWEYKFPSMKVEIDGEEIYAGNGLVFVGNISRYATGLGILYKADFSDGLLDLCIYKCGCWPHLLKHSALTIFKQHTKCSDVVYRQGKNIKIDSAQGDIPTEIDGDPGPAMPVEIKVIPKAVNCIVPKDAKPAGIRARIARAIR